MVSSVAGGMNGRYAVYSEIAAGGMATVHWGRLLGPAGFARLVAIKRLMPNFAHDPEFVAMFLDEARLAGRIRHPNVVPTLDVVAGDGELLLVMEYVHGESLSRLLRRAIEAQQALPLPVISAIVTGALHGLHAAHEATDERGEPLRIVHRDVNPQNLIVASDGTVRVLDFGIASAVGRLQVTRDGQLKGKLPYMAAEQLWSLPLDRRVDVYAMAVVLWECLVRRRLFRGDSDGAVVNRVLHEPVERPSALVDGLPPGLDELVMRGLERERDARFATAQEMALALEALVPPATTSQVARWVEEQVGDVLRLRERRIQEIESQTDARTPGGAIVASTLRQITAEPPLAVESVTPSARSLAAVDLGAITVVEAPASRRPSPRRSAAVVGVLLGTLVVGAGWGLARRDDPTTTREAHGVSALAPVASEASSVVPAVSPASDVAPVAASVSASARPHEAVASGASGRVRAPRRDCASPFYTDSKGIQRVKKQCL